MGYWDKVVEEIVHGANKGSKISLTNAQAYKAVPDNEGKKTKTTKKTTKKYYLGGNFPEMYFTEKELLITTYVFYGRSATETAIALSLSKRTVEYYMKNIKGKLGCRYITDVMRKVLNSDLSDYIKKARHTL